MIIALAGHIDHGKTALIKALTGTDTDRLPEEKARGLSIDLGFAYQSLHDGTTVGFVDVPGHEKFIRNMLAGVAGIDAGLLVVAADDGMMPQTREHIAILQLLGIEPCWVAITKIDKVDNKRVGEVQVQVATVLGETQHGEADMFPVCALNHQGVDALQSALHQYGQKFKARPLDGHFRMAIDRVFTLKGIGLIVTGMVLAGAAKIEDKLLLSSDGSSVRVRGIRANNEICDQARAGQRCAINIVGRRVGEPNVLRGNWLMHPALYAPSNRLDVELHVLDSETRSLKHWTPAHLHIGADHLAARIAVLEGGSVATGQRALAQLVLSRDVFSVNGDRFVLRDQSAQRTIAGGHVIDPHAPKRGRARATRIRALQAMNDRDPADALAALTTSSEVGVSLTEFSRKFNLTNTQTNAMIEALCLHRSGRIDSQWVFNAARWKDLLKRTENTVTAFHRTHPELPGVALHKLQLVLKPYIEIRVLEDVVASLVNDGHLACRGAVIHSPHHACGASEQDRALWARAVNLLTPATGSPMSLHQLADTLEVDIKALEKSFRYAVALGEMISVAENRYVPTNFITILGGIAVDLAENSPEKCFSVAMYCKKSTLGRNFAIELLEYFDRQGFTERIGNQRRIKGSVASVSSDNNESRGRGSHPGGAPGFQIR